MSKSNIDGGGITGYIAERVVALTPASTVAIDASAGGVFTITPGQSETLTVSPVVNGTRLTLIVTTSGTSSYTLTFGTGFKSSGTLATGTSDAKTFVVNFVAANDAYVETGRTAAF